MKSVLSLPDYPRISDREFVIARKEAMATALQLRLAQALSKQQITSLRSLKVVDPTEKPPYPAKSVLTIIAKLRSTPA